MTRPAPARPTRKPPVPPRAARPALPQSPTTQSPTTQGPAAQGPAAKTAQGPASGWKQGKLPQQWTAANAKGLGGEEHRRPAPASTRGAPLMGTRGTPGGDKPAPAKEPPATKFTPWTVTNTDKSGVQGSTETKSTTLEDRSGNKVGKTTTTTTDGSIGLNGETKAEHESSDGRTTTKATGTASGLVGMEGTITTVLKASPDEMSAMVSYLARMGVFGEVKGSMSIDSRKLHAAVDAYAKGGLGIQSEGSVGVEVKMLGLLSSFEATVAFSAQAGLSGEAGFGAEAGFGPLLARVEARIEAFAGAQAKFSGRAFASLSEGAGFEADASAMAGARAELSGLTSVHVGSVAMEVSGGVVVFAGATAAASGSVAVSLTGVTITGKASAFAGVKAELTGKAALKLRGRDIISATGKVGVSAGVGVEAGGTFGLNAGKITLYGEIAGALKGGVSLGAGASIDFWALAVGIAEEVSESYYREQRLSTIEGPGFTRTEIADPELAKQKRAKAYEAVYETFSNYARKKEVGGENGIKQEVIEDIIRTRLDALDFTYRETDRGVEDAAVDAFGPLLPTFMLNRGNVAAFAALKGDALTELKGDALKLAAYKAASKHLTKDLDDYAQKKAHTGESGVKRTVVQQIVDKHWKELAEAYGPAQAPSVVAGLVRATLGAYLQKFEMKTDGRPGEIGEFTAPESAAAAVKQAATDTDEATKAISSMSTLREKLELLKKAALSAEVAKGSRSRAEKKLTKKLAGVPPISKVAVQRVIDAWIADELPKLTNDVALKYLAKLVGITLAPLVKADGVKLFGTTVLELPSDQSADQILLSQAGTQLDKSRDDAIEKVGVSARAYLDTTLKQTTGTVTAPQLQKRVDKAVSKVRDAVVRGQLDARLTQTLTEALEPISAVLDVVNGKVRLQVDPSHVGEARQLFARSGGPKLSGPAEDNQRTKAISQALTKPLGAYKSQIEQAALRSARTNKAASVTPSKAGLSQLIAKNLAKVRADVHNETGEAELTTLSHDIFLVDSPAGSRNVSMFSKLTFTLSQLDKVELTPNYPAKLLAARNQPGLEKRARDGLLTDLRSYVQTCDTEGREPSQSVIQAIAGKHRRTLTSMSPEEADLLVWACIGQALPGRLRTLEVEAGAVTIQFKRLTGTHRT